MKKVLRKITPPVIWDLVKSARSRPAEKKKSQVVVEAGDGSKQDLDLYWDQQMADILDNWGKDHVWNEIEMFLIGRKGKVLDIACGTGITIEILSKQKDLQLYGCDISDFLIGKAIDKGIDKNTLVVCDATDMHMYADNQFDYSFSIGSLEHFTEEGIVKFVSEVNRITKYSSYHMMPVSRSGKNEGWLKTYQSFHNNSVEWWVNNFKTKYSDVYVISSGWNDRISVGKWFVCTKNSPC